MTGAALSRAVPSFARGKRNKKKHKEKKPHALFYDDFKRPDRRGWGSDWYNQRYGRNWSIQDRKAIYRLPATENSLYYRPNPILVLDHEVETLDVRATVSSSNTSARIGIVLRATGYATYYAIYLGPNDVLRLTRCDHHDELLLAKKDVRFLPNQRYRIRARISGANAATIKAKVWPVGAFEPARWGIDVTDATPQTIPGRGSFGVFAEHAIDGRGAALRVLEYVAYSQDRPSVTPAHIVYSLVGPPDNEHVSAVAKTAVPATVGFQVSKEPTFSTSTRIVHAGRTGRAETARAELDLATLGPSSVVHWRAFADRNGRRVYGPSSSFRTGPDPTQRLPVRFAFGSCTKWQSSPRHSFEQARLEQVDFYLHQGDFGYVKNRVIDHDPDTYQDHWTRMLMDRDLLRMTRDVPFGFYQDDADYGQNNADAKTLRPFTIHAWDEMHANPPGAYFTFQYGDVHFFCLDCRRFSTGKNDPMDKRHKIGAAQKKWLFDSMAAAAEKDPGLLVVASPQTLGSDASPGSWRRSFETEWAEVIEFLEDLGAPVLIVSGDSHGHRLYEYPQRNLDPDVPRIVEFLSSGTEQNRWSTDIDASFLVREARKESGFGLVELGPEQDVAGQKTRTLTLTALSSADGTPLWRPATYLVVRGVGIVPAGI
ncbi:MAG TPA: alkaline phosphatase D family protein [Actinomycetota bacterium]